MSSDFENYRIDKRQVRAAFERAAPNYDAVAVLQREVGNRVLERLQLIRTTPERILDIGAGTGYFSMRLAASVAYVRPCQGRTGTAGSRTWDHSLAD